MDTFVACNVSVWRRGGNFERQAIGPLEGVTIPDEEWSWFLVL